MELRLCLQRLVIDAKRPEWQSLRRRMLLVSFSPYKYKGQGENKDLSNFFPKFFRHVIRDSFRETFRHLINLLVLLNCIWLLLSLTVQDG